MTARWESLPASTARTPHPASCLRRKGRSDRPERSFLRQRGCKPGQGEHSCFQWVAGQFRRERLERPEFVGFTRERLETGVWGLFSSRVSCRFGPFKPFRPLPFGFT